MKTLILLALGASSLIATPTVINHGPTTCFATSGNIACAFQSSVTAGNALVVSGEYRINAATGVTTVADSLSTSYSQVVTSSTASQTGGWMYCGIAGSSGANTVTITMNGSYFFGHVLIAEMSGTNGCTLDGTPTGHNITSGLPIVCDPVTTSLSNSLMMTSVYDNANSFTLAAPSGYTGAQLQSTGGTAREAGLAYKLKAVAGAETPGWSDTGTSGANNCLVAAFAAVAGSATTRHRVVAP